MAYLEQSTRYVPYDSRLSTGHYRYHRDPEVLESSVGARYVGDMDRMFDTYGTSLPELQAWLSKRFPQRAGDSDFVYRQSIRAKALDALRGLLPAGSLSNVGVYGTGQSYEMLLLRMRAHPLPEARRYAQLMLEELRKVIPSFLQRVDIPERGGVWTEYLADTASQTDEVVSRLWPDARGAPPEQAARAWPWWTGTPKARTRSWRPCATRARRCRTRRCCGGSGPSGPRTGARSCGPMWGSAPTAGIDRVGPSSAPDTGSTWSRTTGRFVTCSATACSPSSGRTSVRALGYEMPDTVEEAGLAERYAPLDGRSADLYDVMTRACPTQAPYAVALAFRVRYAMQMNAREAMHMLELRSGEQGHPAYRRRGAGHAPAHRRARRAPAHRRGHDVCGPSIL